MSLFGKRPASVGSESYTPAVAPEPVVEEVVEPKIEILRLEVFEDEESDNIDFHVFGSGFDAENDFIVVDLLRLVLNSYGYDIEELED